MTLRVYDHSLESWVDTSPSKREFDEHSTKVGDETELGHVKVDGSSIKSTDGVISVDSNLINHVVNEDIHITSEERTSWTNKADEAFVEQKVADLVNATGIKGRNLFALKQLPTQRTFTKTDTGFVSTGAWADTLVDTDRVLSMLEANTQYTISYDVVVDTKTSGATIATQASHLSLWLYSSTEGYRSVEMGIGIIGNVVEADALQVGQKLRRVATFTTPENLHDADAKYRIIYYTIRRIKTDGSTVLEKATFSKLKIEKGNKATDWTLAPEDSDAKLSEHLAENSGKHIHSSGSNANGDWIKFDDGTLICYGTVNINQMYDSTVITGYPVFAANFANQKIKVVSMLKSLPATMLTEFKSATLSADVDSVGTAIITLSDKNGSFASGDVAVADYIAIGRWKEQ